MESLSMVSHTNALIKNRETIDINLYEQFIKYLDASPKTVETYKKSLKQMFSYLLSNNVTSPRREDLLAYRNYLFAKGLKPTTIQNYITAAKIFFTWTNEEGYYPNIAEHIK
ncbi:MAG: site-specific integrase [[Eubacterium] siraeum]|jgi:putative integrase